MGPDHHAICRSSAYIGILHTYLGAREAVHVGLNVNFNLTSFLPPTRLTRNLLREDGEHKLTMKRLPSEMSNTHTVQPIIRQPRPTVLLHHEKRSSRFPCAQARQDRYYRNTDITTSHHKCATFPLCHQSQTPLKQRTLKEVMSFPIFITSSKLP